MSESLVRTTGARDAKDRIKGTEQGGKERETRGRLESWVGTSGMNG